MDFKISAADFVFEHRGKLHDTYKIGRKIAEGNYSSVRTLRHLETWEPRAVKVINKKGMPEPQAANLLNEIGILRQMDHPNIVKLYEYYQDEKKYYIITELCEGGELFEKIIKKSLFS